MRTMPTIFCFTIPILMTLCAAGPPPKGAEVNMHAGTGSFEYASGGCGGPTYMNRANEVSGFGAATYRSEVGVSAGAEVSAAGAKTVSSRVSAGAEPGEPRVDEDEIGRERQAYAGAARFGYHHDYFGIEGGGMVLSVDGDMITLPSATTWAGYPRYAYVFGDFLAGPTSLSHLPIDIGLGHASEHVRAQLGMGFAEPSVLVAGAYGIGGALFVGGRLRQYVEAGRNGTTGALTLAYNW